VTRRILVAGVVLVATGCGSSKTPVAQLGTTTTTSSGTSPVAYAGCMRSNGVRSWPDPNSSGGFDKSKLTPQHLRVGESEIAKAQRSCQHLLPKGFGTPTSAQVQQYRHSMLIYAACIRHHGVPNMPDPDARGHLDIGPGTAVDVNSPKFEHAYQACKSDLQP
jgi:hypothetical protein